MTAHLLGDRERRHFFQILVLSDDIDEKAFGHFGARFVSRNHPDLIGQGFFRTQQPRVDFCAFLTAEGPSYGIVDLRLFDLTHGRTILIAPQADGSLRSMQIDRDGPADVGDPMPWIDALCAEPEVRAFFLAPGSI